MKNANELQVLLMTRKNRSYSYFYKIGMLGAMGFPSDRCHTVMDKWGISIVKMVEDAIEDGFPWFERFVEDGRAPGIPHYMAYVGGLWSFCRCLRYISQRDYPCLVVEDDRRLLVDWDEILKRLKTLPQDADTVLLTDRGGEPYDDYWTRTYSKGGIATMAIYSPLGAKKALAIASNEGSPEEWKRMMAAKFCDKTTYCSSEMLYHPPFQDPSISPQYLSTIVTHTHYDRWMEGVDVDEREHVSDDRVLCEVDLDG